VPGSTIYTDGLKSYEGLKEAGFQHIASTSRSAQNCARVRSPRFHLPIERSATCSNGCLAPTTVSARINSRFTSMSSSFDTIVARRRRPLSRRSLGLEPPANQPSTSRFARHEISTTTDWGLLKQPDNQKLARSACRNSKRNVTPSERHRNSGRGTRLWPQGVAGQLPFSAGFPFGATDPALNLAAEYLPIMQ
jgi:transposase-like protein